MIIVSRSGFANLVDRMNAVIGPVGPATGVLNFINIFRVYSGKNAAGEVDNSWQRLE
jgi:hypothetical protein